MNQRLKELRNALHLTQKAFADKIGAKQSTIATYEIGRNNPSDPIIHSICLAFGVNEDWLRNGTGEMFLPEPSDEIDMLVKRYSLSAEMKVLIQKLVQTPPDVQKSLVSLMSEIVANFPKE